MYRFYWLLVFSLPAFAEPFLPYSPTEVSDAKRLAFCAVFSLLFRVVVLLQRRNAKKLSEVFWDALLTGFIAGGILGLLVLAKIEISFVVEYLAALAVASRGPGAIALINTWLEAKTNTKGGE